MYVCVTYVYTCVGECCFYEEIKTYLAGDHEMLFFCCIGGCLRLNISRTGAREIPLQRLGLSIAIIYVHIGPMYN